MKQPFFLIFFCLMSAFLFGQIPAGPVYLLFNSTCMNQLEYRYAYSGAQVLAYAIQSAPDKQLIFYSGSNGVNAPAMPAGALDCASIKLDPAFVDAVNKNQKQVYMVHQTQTGYLMMPLIAALQVERNGSYYFFRGANFQFAIDTLNLVYQANLSSTGSPNQVYFAGLQIKDCLYQYAFRGEPTQAGKEKTDFEFIPGIGMISERSGMTTNDMESNQTRLWFVNGMSLDDYIAQKCGTQGQSNILPSEWTLPDRPAEQKPQPIPAPLPMDVPCPESSGPGYHIVQPKETLMAISRRYKVPLASLIKWNGIAAPDKIEVCQKVFVVNPATLKSPTPARPPVAPLQPSTVLPKPATPLLHTVK
ncbi:MAG: LysM peptidoglycan-binding domain-containing protein, partial [Saprospiraceae bacterium]